MPPILKNKNTAAPSIFKAGALLREARRQKNIPAVEVPPFCILDPDGDIVRKLRSEGRSEPLEAWPCYHTQLDIFTLNGRSVGIIGSAVGASFAVLVAEELFACGCRFLLSLTSAGQINSSGPTPYFIVIDRALRDEGTSYHYAPPADFADADANIIKQARVALGVKNKTIIVGPTWTTDAPFRETAEAVEAARSQGVLAVEMEAAALYAFAWATRSRVLCLAQVTNTMGQAGEDFDKGHDGGTADALEVLGALVGLADD